MNNNQNINPGSYSATNGEIQTWERMDIDQVDGAFSGQTNKPTVLVPLPLPTNDHEKKVDEWICESLKSTSISRKKNIYRRLKTMNLKALERFKAKFVGADDYGFFYFQAEDEKVLV
jgi:hypothetical protein